MKIHKIRIDKCYADAVLAGKKTFEICYNDRGYQVGDMVKFTCTLHALAEKTFQIGYLLHTPGLKEGWCVFSIFEIEGSGNE